MEEKKKEIRISVRNLVEFILRSGDLDNSSGGFGERDAMQAGTRVHQQIQKKRGADYRAEVPLVHEKEYEHFILRVEGRADGMYEDGTTTVIEEIKGTYRDLETMEEPVPVHLAQAKCYAYIYGLQNRKEEMGVLMTYTLLSSEEEGLLRPLTKEEVKPEHSNWRIRHFLQTYKLPELEQWFDELLDAWFIWAEFQYQWQKARDASMQHLEFPFPYRKGQRELVSGVYRTILRKKELFVQAPTGIGKTMSTVFPAIRAIGEGCGDRLFYLTAKTITRTVAEEAISILKEKGLQFKAITLTAKEKMCILDEPECDPIHCPRAKGHFDRINAAVYEMLTECDSYTREEVLRQAEKWNVCPHEFQFDVASWVDGVICDYNYAFDPTSKLKRFFAEGTKGDYIFLIDEAHNLLERGREMYSAPLRKEDLLELKREIKQTIMSEMEEAAFKKRDKDEISGQMTLEMTDASKQLPQVSIPEESDGTDSLYIKGHKLKKSDGKSTFVREGYAERISQMLEKCNAQLLSMKRDCDGYRLVDDIDMLVQPLTRLHGIISDYLEEQEKVSLEVRENLLDFYFKLSHFLDIYERQDENYVKYTRMCEDGSFELKLFCVNPRENLKECMLRGRSTILFSATFLPIQYYKNLLGGEKEDYEVYAHSVFDPEKRTILIAGDVTSKFTRRSREEYYNIARYIHEVVKNRHGNYMVFFPSYSFMEHIYEIYEQYFMTEEEECLVQQESMNEEEREYFLNRFRGNEDCDLQSLIGMEIEEEEEQTLIGFCVLGGIFGEGIDLKKDSLIGVIVVGTGLPQVGCEREILKDYFDDNGENGFDYSYRYPGMNKVLQAAGRVIRTAEDVGIIVLLDERFRQYSYRRMFPREWEQVVPVTVDTVAKKVERFWDAWLWQQR